MSTESVDAEHGHVGYEVAPFFGIDPDEERRKRERFGRQGGQIGAIPMQQPMPTPCSVAWQVPAHRTEIRRWVERWPEGTGSLLVPVVMPDTRGLRTAVFVRRLMQVAGSLVVVAACSLRGTVYTGLPARRAS